MFINFWYPAELASAVTTNPVRVKLLGQNFVVFRDAQTVETSAEAQGPSFPQQL